MNPADTILALTDRLVAAGWQTEGLVVAALLLLAALVVAAGIAMTAALIRTSRIWSTMSAEARRMEDFREMMAAYGQTLIATHASLARAEDKIDKFTARSLEIQSQFAHSFSFEEASRMIRDGSSARALVDDCGLSDAEAELMVRVHQPSERTPRKHLKQAPPAAMAAAESAVREKAATSEAEERLREALAARLK